MNNNGKKIMIINWKWTWFHDHRVTSDYLAENKNFTQNIKKGKGKFYEEYIVKKEGKIDQDTALDDSIIVATSIYKHFDTQIILYNLIDYYYNKYRLQNPIIFLFLHRGNFYHKSDVYNILNNKPEINQCFLFAHPSDFIYYKTLKKGFLDDAGGFSKEGKVCQKINGKKIIKAKFFNDVWNYYQHEFKSKIFTLKEDLFLNLSFLTESSTNEFCSFALRERLSKSNDLLLLRLKSFLGFYDNVSLHESNELSEELELIDDFLTIDNDLFIDIEYSEYESLKKLEKKRHTSYEFDDCNANLEHIQPNNEDDKKANELYLELIQKLSPLVKEDKKHYFTFNEFYTIRERFEQLINVLPGEKI